MPLFSAVDEGLACSAFTAETPLTVWLPKKRTQHCKCADALPISEEDFRHVAYDGGLPWHTVYQLPLTAIPTMRTLLGSSSTTSETRTEGSRCTACQAPVQWKPIAHIYTDRYKHRLPKLQRRTMIPAPSETRLRLLTVGTTHVSSRSQPIWPSKPGSCRSRRI